MTGRTARGTAAGRVGDARTAGDQPRVRGDAAGRDRRADVPERARMAGIAGRGRDSEVVGRGRRPARETAAVPEVRAARDRMDGDRRPGAGSGAARRSPVPDTGDCRTRGSTALAPAHRTVTNPAVDTARPRLRVAPPPPVAVPRAPFVATVLLLVVVGVVGILVLNTKINENAFRLGRLQDQKSTLDAKEQDLSAQLSNVESPGNLAAEAKRLGLVYAGPPAFIRLPDGRKLGIPQPAPGR